MSLFSFRKRNRTCEICNILVEEKGFKVCKDCEKYTNWGKKL